MPKPTHMLRAAILCGWLLIVAILVCFTALDLPLPPEVQAYEDRQAEAEMTTSEWVSLAVIVPLLLVNFASSIGLWFLARWARTVYAITSLAMIPALLLGEPSFDPPLMDALGELSTFITGFIVALSYYGKLELWPARPQE